MADHGRLSKGLIYSASEWNLSYAGQFQHHWKDCCFEEFGRKSLDSIVIAYSIHGMTPFKMCRATACLTCLKMWQCKALCIGPSLYVDDNCDGELWWLRKGWHKCFHTVQAAFYFGLDTDYACTHLASEEYSLLQMASLCISENHG